MLGYSEAFADEDKDWWRTTRSHDSNCVVDQITVRWVIHDRGVGQRSSHCLKLLRPSMFQVDRVTRRPDIRRTLHAGVQGI